MRLVLPSSPATLLPGGWGRGKGTQVVPGPGGTKGHLKESSYANLILKNCTIQTTISTTTNIPTRKPRKTIVTEKTICYFYMLSTLGKVSWLLVGLESSFWIQNGVKLNPLHWCTLQGSTKWLSRLSEFLTEKIYPLENKFPSQKQILVRVSVKETHFCHK